MGRWTAPTADGEILGVEVRVFSWSVGGRSQVSRIEVLFEGWRIRLVNLRDGALEGGGTSPGAFEALEQVPFIMAMRIFRDPPA
jgi:hypothetical protein